MHEILLVLVLVLVPQLHAQEPVPPLQTGSIRFTGNSALDSAALLREMDTRPGAVFRDATLNADLRRIALAYDAAGYPFAEVSVADVRIRARGALEGDDGSPVENGILLVDVFLEIDEGPLFFIDEITVEGNKLTDADVIVRETRIATPARYDPETIGDLVRRLERMQIFTRVEEPQLYQRDSVGGLLLRVTEGGANRFDGVIGYQPP
ncbi:MAG: hypothetical protein KFF77_05945, partial [Bacteroidetes bacterium]|nr:hypothetical protein [Bacteroidota bacterium]